MKTQSIKISQVKINNENPRTITTDKFQKLIASILVLPEMLELRPIVTDKTYTALGGNMRAQALKAISTFSIDDIKARLNNSRDFLEKKDDEKRKLISYWEKWLANPVVTVVDASTLTASQKKEFIIKDNVSYGSWDYDGLANKFENAKLQDWGMDVWNPDQFAPVGGMQNVMGSAPSSFAPTPSAPTVEENDGEIPTDALPPELQGIDLTPADLPKIEGADETPMERVIIVFPKGDKAKLAGLLGLESIDKVIYQLAEIMPE